MIVLTKINNMGKYGSERRRYEFIFQFIFLKETVLFLPNIKLLQSVPVMSLIALFRMISMTSISLNSSLLT